MLQVVLVISWNESCDSACLTGLSAVPVVVTAHLGVGRFAERPGSGLVEKQHRRPVVQYPPASHSHCRHRSTARPEVLEAGILPLLVLLPALVGPGRGQSLVCRLEPSPGRGCSTVLPSQEEAVSCRPACWRCALRPGVTELHIPQPCSLPSVLAS